LLAVGLGGGAGASGWGPCVGALSPANKRNFFGVPGVRRWRCRSVVEGGAGAGLSAADAPPMRFGSRLGLRREVSGLLLFCERRDDLASPWGAFSGPSSPVAEEGGSSGVASSSPVWELLMCHSGSRCVMDAAPWRWLLQRNHALELLGGETNFSCFVGASGRRCYAMTKARKTKDFNVIFVFLEVFFAIWGCTVLLF